jgi:hypothetical protein
MGSVEDNFRNLLPKAKVRTGLAVRGEVVSQTGPELDDWLRKSQLIR